MTVKDKEEVLKRIQAAGDRASFWDLRACLRQACARLWNSKT